MWWNHCRYGRTQRGLAQCGLAQCGQRLGLLALAVRRPRTRRHCRARPLRPAAAARRPGAGRPLRPRPARRRPRHHRCLRGRLRLVAAGEHGWGAPTVLGPLAVGAALLLAFAAAERRTTDPLLPPGFLAGRRRATTLAAVMATTAGTALTFLLLSLYLQQVCGWGVPATSAAFLPYAAVLLLAGRLAAPLAARYGAAAVTAGGLAVAAAGLSLLAGLTPATPYVTGLLPAGAGAGAGPAFAGAAVLATHGVPPDRTGLAAGVLNTAVELGPTTGVAP
ncbi:MFS transporter [Streptomyces sp. CB01881]|uniref:MFS transporter n=1 Tax=Streptomyces sp. CB01881 TaxID=2078691 RepID=UPI003211EDFF